MKKTLLTSAILFMAIGFISCQKESLQSNSSPNVQKDDNQILGRNGDGSPCPTTTVTLLAGQTINAGTVSVTNDSNFIYVTYTTANGYLMTQTHLYVGDCALIPINNPGNPIPGQFPYSATHNNITTYTYQIPLSAIPAGGCGCIAAHCVVVKLNASGNVIETQTGWGNGTRINLSGGNWGMKFEYCSCIL